MFVKHAGANKFQRNAQEFGASQRSVELVIFGIHSENLHVFGNCGLKKEFDDWHGCGQRRSLAGIVDAIATNSATNAVRNIARLITLHLYLRVVIRGDFSSMDRLVGDMEGGESFRRKQAIEFLDFCCDLMMSVRTVNGGGVRERLASNIEVQSGGVGRVESESIRGRLSGIRSNGTSRGE